MASGSIQAFRPAGTIAIEASTNTMSATLAGGGQTILVYNASENIAFFRLGASSALMASVGDTPVPPGTRIMVDGGPFITDVAVLLNSGSGTVYFTRGDGDIY